MIFTHGTVRLDQCERLHARWARTQIEIDRHHAGIKGLQDSIAECCLPGWRRHDTSKSLARSGGFERDPR